MSQPIPVGPELDIPAFKYAGFHGTPSRCRLRVYRGRDGGAVILATWDAHSDGTSITNAAELVATGAARHLGLEAFTWVEHYAFGEESHRAGPSDSFDLVTFQGNKSEGFRDPSWRHLGREGFLELLAIPQPENLDD